MSPLATMSQPIRPWPAPRPKSSSARFSIGRLNQPFAQKTTNGAAHQPNSCTVVTTTAVDSLGHTHDRMPMLVERDRWADWLDPRRTGDTSLLVPAAPGRLEAYPVSTLVSNVRNNGPELVEPLPLEESLA